MTPVRAWLLVIFLAGAGVAQQPGAGSGQFQAAGVCARCHVAAVLEWSTSRHTMAGVDCKACHGASAGHVADERNQTKPERIPHGAAIAGLCQSCHTRGCGKTGSREACESCHHSHALFNPTEKALAPLDTPEERQAREFQRAMAAAESAISAANWGSASTHLEQALRLSPRHPGATRRLTMVRRRVNPALPGFDIITSDFDATTGLPLAVRVSGLPVEMVLIRGGDTDLGDEQIPSARPAHTVTVAPFYLARNELTQRVWAMLETTNPSLHRGEQLPVNNISWVDAVQWLNKLNARVAGGGFRLPTEAEWEHAARLDGAGVNLAERAWFRHDSGERHLQQLDAYAPRAAGSLRAGTLGLFDMAGNVWEWCSSLFEPYPYVADDGRESAQAPGLRVLRGGGYADPADLLSPALRHGERPHRRFPFNGMRLARTVPPPQ